ncbi:hypothetical protein NQ318_010799 [Aromia moschata]|uniref:H15 domain-containing protein n=1 Tax=Aromia moschata TaxID=1265417 RepID=A0AAV8XCP2_9CUCU|nr:hypothetical protein NQ318_010799 [Aromia moschata]
MKKSSHQPRLLTAVMEAIASLKEGKGSTQKKIIEQVQTSLSSKNASVRNVMVQIRRAIRHGVESGLIKQKGGKFRLGLASKDYAVFRNFQKIDKGGDAPVREHRRRGRRRRRRSRRRRRRRRSMEDDSGERYGSESAMGVMHGRRLAHVAVEAQKHTQRFK